MTGPRLQACLPAAAFAALAWVMAGTGRVPGVESLVAAVSVALALVPSGWLAPLGWRRRAAEASLVPAALALVFLGDQTLRAMALPPLLAVVALAAAAAALRVVAAGERWAIVAALGLAVRAAGGLALSGTAAWRVALVVALVFAASALAGRFLSPAAAALVATAAGAAPLERLHTLPLAVVAAAGAGAAAAAARGARDGRLATAWGVPLVAAVLIGTSLAPWGGLPPARAFPTAGWGVLAAAGGVAVAAPFLPPALAGAAWLGAASLAGEPLPPPPDRPGVVLTAASAEAVLPAGDGGLYLIDLSLANAAAVPQGTVVARVVDAGPAVEIRAGVETAEWAHERDDVRLAAAHRLPDRVVWLPSGLGGGATWAVAGRVSLHVPAAAKPRLVRAAALPPDVAVGVGASGPSRPTPPRDWPAPAWILAAAAVVALLQLAGRSWRAPAAALPWAVLVTLALAVRIPVSPLRLLAERHAPDLALASVLAAWLPLARLWLSRRRTFLAAAALLVPLALATPHLTPPLYGDEPFHLIVLDSLARDHDLDLSNNYDLQRHPYNRIYITGKVFLHSPVLACLLLPGFLLGGRAGALALLALAGSGVAALVVRRARQLGVGRRRCANTALGLLLTYPLATVSTQIWVEVVAALAVAACLVLLARPDARRLATTAVAAAAVGVKTRLGLVTAPLALVAWWPRRRSPREVAAGAAVLGAAMAAALAVEAAFLGHPLGLRRLPDLLPRDLRQPAIVIGGFLFDPAGGLAFAAPLALLAGAGLPALWRRGGWGERAATIGGVLTVAALLHSLEWCGGGSPPARYLVPFLPLFALAFAVTPTSPARSAFASLAALVSVFVWWVLVTRPHFSVNPGDGGWWLEDAFARRFAADARHLFPSFLRIAPATVVVPALIMTAVFAVVMATRAFPGLGGALARAAVPLSLATVALFVVLLTTRRDHNVEIEDPQVGHLGGTIEPEEGTYSRFTLPSGWRVKDGEGVEVPLNLPADARLRLEGWLEGPARQGAELVLRWDHDEPQRVPVRGVAHGSVALPSPPSPGRHRLAVVLAAPSGGEAVLDRVVVTP